MHEAEAMLEAAGEEGSAAVAQAQQRAAEPAACHVLAAVHAAMLDDLGTPQVRRTAVAAVSPLPPLRARVAFCVGVSHRTVVVSLSRSSHIGDHELLTSGWQSHLLFRVTLRNWVRRWLETS